MNPGKLDRPFTLLARTQAVDGAGAPVETWAAVAGLLWAEEVKVAGAEANSAGTPRATRALTLRVRYNASLEAIAAPGAYRVRYAGRDYDLTAAVEDTSRARRAFQLLTLDHIQGHPTLTSVPTV